MIYWRTVISAVKGRYREFRFIAEAYWDLDCELQHRALILLRQEASITGWNTRTPRAWGCISLSILLTRREWSGSFETMTSPGLPPRFRKRARCSLGNPHTHRG